MKVLVFNDTHLSDKFDQELYDYIVNLVKKADKVIINGDFWDGYLVSFDAFMNSRWSDLFPILKKKNCVYITGNHDKPEFMDERVICFAEQVVEQFTLRQSGNTFHFQHGNGIAPTHDRHKIFQNPIYLRFVYSFFTNWYLKLDRYIKIYAIHEYYKALTQLKAFRNHVQRFKLANLKSKNHYFIFGHTHLHAHFKKEKIISVGALQKYRKNYLFISDGKLQPHPQLKSIQ